MFSILEIHNLVRVILYTRTDTMSCVAKFVKFTKCRAKQSGVFNAKNDANAWFHHDNTCPEAIALKKKAMKNLQSKNEAAKPYDWIPVGDKNQTVLKELHHLKDQMETLINRTDYMCYIQIHLQPEAAQPSF